MLTSAKLLDQFTLSDRIGVQEGALRDRDVELLAILGDCETSDGFLTVGSVDEVFFDPTLATHDRELLRYDNDVDFAGLRGVLKD